MYVPIVVIMLQVGILFYTVCAYSTKKKNVWKSKIWIFLFELSSPFSIISTFLLHFHALWDCHWHYLKLVTSNRPREALQQGWDWVDPLRAGQYKWNRRSVSLSQCHDLLIKHITLWTYMPLFYHCVLKVKTVNYAQLVYNFLKQFYWNSQIYY